MIAFHYRFGIINGICGFVSQPLDNDIFLYKDYNRVRYLSIEISRTDKIIIFGLQIGIEEISS